MIDPIGNGSSGGAAHKTAGARAGAADSFQQALEAFLKEASKTPAERARDEVLKQHGLSEEAYRALPPEQKKAVDAEIVAAVQRTLRAHPGKGFNGADAVALAAGGGAESSGFLLA